MTEMFQHALQETRSRMLPKPGEYTVQYVATVRNRGGQQYHHTLTSPAYHYRAVAGPVTDCGAHGWPDKVHLGTGLDSVYVELRDKAGNVARVAAVPPVSFSSDALTITYGAVQWEELAGSAPRLQLAGLVLEPTASFKASGAGTATQCGVELHVNLDKGPPLVNKFDISVYPGEQFHRTPHMQRLLLLAHVTVLLPGCVIPTGCSGCVGRHALLLCDSWFTHCAHCRQARRTATHHSKASVLQQCRG